MTLPMASITRLNKDDNPTLGEFVYNEFTCKTLELAWHQNKTNISCIPTAMYECEKYLSNTHGHCIKIMDVPDRTLIRIHAANHDRELLGCVAVGARHIDFDGDGRTDVTSSKKTLEKMMAILPDKFMLEVV